MTYAAEWEAEHKRRLIESREFPALCKFVDSAIFNRSYDGRAMYAIDIGCGTGGTARWLHKRGFARVVGIDGSLSAITNAMRYGDCDAGAPPIEYRVIDVTDGPLPFPDRSFDLAVDIRCLENIAERSIFEVFTEIARVLKPGGHFFSRTASLERNDAQTTVGKVRKLSIAGAYNALRVAGFIHVYSEAVNDRGVADLQIEAIK